MYDVEAIGSVGVVTEMMHVCGGNDGVVATGGFAIESLRLVVAPCPCSSSSSNAHTLPL